MVVFELFCPFAVSSSVSVSNLAISDSSLGITWSMKLYFLLFLDAVEAVCPSIRDRTLNLKTVLSSFADRGCCSVWFSFFSFFRHLSIMYFSGIAFTRRCNITFKMWEHNIPSFSNLQQMHEYSMVSGFTCTRNCWNNHLKVPACSLTMNAHPKSPVD